MRNQNNYLIFFHLFRMTLDITVKWNGKLFNLSFDDPETSIGALRSKLFEDTRVRPDRQKILGVKGKDDAKLAGSFKSGKPVMMIGSAEEDIKVIEVNTF